MWSSLDYTRYTRPHWQLIWLTRILFIYSKFGLWICKSRPSIIIEHTNFELSDRCMPHYYPGIDGIQEASKVKETMRYPETITSRNHPFTAGCSSITTRGVRVVTLTQSWSVGLFVCVLPSVLYLRRPSSIKLHPPLNSPAQQVVPVQFPPSLS